MVPLNQGTAVNFQVGLFIEDHFSRLQICPRKTSSETNKATYQKGSKYWFPPGFGGLIQGQIYNPVFFTGLNIILRHLHISSDENPRLGVVFLDISNLAHDTSGFHVIIPK